MYLKEFNKKIVSSLQVQKAGEVMMMAGVAAAVGIGIVALAGAFFGGNRKEKENKWNPRRPIPGFDE